MSAYFVKGANRLFLCGMNNFSPVRLGEAYLTAEKTIKKMLEDGDTVFATSTQRQQAEDGLLKSGFKQVGGEACDKTQHSDTKVTIWAANSKDLMAVIENASKAALEAVSKIEVDQVYMRNDRRSYCVIQEVNKKQGKALIWSWTLSLWAPGQQMPERLRRNGHWVSASVITDEYSPMSEKDIEAKVFQYNRAQTRGW